MQVAVKGIDIDGEEYLYASSRDITQELNAYKKLQNFIDLQDNIVVLSDSKKLKFANKKFYEFTGFKDLSAFCEKFRSINELFIENDRFFHLGKIKKGLNWIEELEKLPSQDRIVGMLKHDYAVHAFAVTINRFENKKFILTFTDITQTIISRLELEDKTLHDKLTNALNREFFDVNYMKIIDKFTENKSLFALAFIDIDHFKKVNDTYGHDVGDETLIHFVKTIKSISREEDILIRWGGEEFIFLFKVKSNEGVKKALENIRETIEKEEFLVVENLTCSIGATIYKEGEDISKTIKRADEMVYKAKKNGRNRVEITL